MVRLWPECELWKLLLRSGLNVYIWFSLGAYLHWLLHAMGFLMLPWVAFCSGAASNADVFLGNGVSGVPSVT